MKFDFSQIIDKFNQLDIKIRYAIFAGLLVLIFVLDFFTILGLQLGGLHKVDEDNLTMKQNIERLKADSQRVNQMKASLENSRSQLEALNVKIRPLEEVSSLLEDISKVAVDSGVKIEQLTPQSEPPQALISTGPMKYYSLPVVIQATSGYHVFGRFMSQLESANLFFTVSNLTIEDRNGDANSHNVSATLKFVLSEKNAGGQK